MNIASLLGKIGFSIDEKPLEGVKDSLEGIKSRLELLAAAEVLHKVFELAESFGHFAEQLGIAATSAGITVEALQRLQYSAGLAGVGAEEVSTGMGHLTRTLDAARKGSQEAVDAFAAVGIGPAQIASFKTSEEALAAFSNGMSKIDQPLKRQATAFAILGRGAVNMVEWVSQGSVAIKAQGKEADRLAAIIDGNTIESLRAMEDAMSSLFTTFKAFAATVFGYVAPAIKAFANSLQEAFAANQAFIRIKIKEWAEKMAFVFGFLWGVVRGLTERFLEFARAHPVLVARAMELAGAMFVLGTILVGLGAAATAVSFAFGLVKTGFMVLGGPAIGLWKALDLFKGVFSWILLGLGRLVTFLFPQVGAWITRIGVKLLFSPLGIILLKLTAIAAIIFAIGAAGYTAYEMMFKHKKFEDTWLGGLWKKGGGILKNIGEYLGLTGDESSIEGAAKNTASPFLETMKDVNGSQDYLNERGGRGPLATTPQMQHDADIATMNRVFNITAPITVNVPAGAAGDNTLLAKNISEQVTKSLGVLMRQSQQSLNNGNRAM